MHGSTLKAKGHNYPKYVCSTYCRSGKSKPRDLEAEATAIAGWLEELGSDLTKASPARLREVFVYLVAQVDLRFSRQQRGKRVECPFLFGEIHPENRRGFYLRFCKSG